MGDDRYPPIADYGYIGDCHSGALISKAGSIDWCCLPRVDSQSCFGRILDWQQGGYCQIAPAVSYRTSRRYLDNTLVLETTFHTGTGAARLLDCFTMRQGGVRTPYRQILRSIEGIDGEVPISVEVVPRFDYGSIKPWIRRIDDYQHTALGGSDGLLISGDIPLAMKHRHDLTGDYTIREGQRLHLSILWRRPENLEDRRENPPTHEELDRRFQETVDWWHTWASHCTYQGPYADAVLRSAMVLKALVNGPTGAIAAAPTTSLPESPGGVRNWDYRFSWVRDSSFTVHSLADLGFVREADGFRRFVERSTAGEADQLQILYGVGGERRLSEQVIENLEGYRGARPVRIGNAAEHQVQLDVFGETLDLAWRWQSRGHSPDNEYWEFLVALVNRTCELWRRPDRGIWEMRGEPRHFVQSKVMCWAAVDRGIRLARDLGRHAPLDVWEKTRSEIRAVIEEQGYDSRRGVFVQAFDHPAADASLLLVPMVDFVAYDDERMIRTTDAIRESLDEGGFLRRYPVGDDELPGVEGVFLPGSFWLVNCLARQRRLKEARAAFERTLSAANDLSLFSEEYDPANGQMLGNFPQALTHLSLITAAKALADMPSERK
ncbi:MAG: glycoside hydrolase family 15 protein [Solirubrobacterales bacterium]